MKFEVSERIHTRRSAEEILLGIEGHFKKISESVRRSGQTVVAESIEASFGSINRNDTTTISLQKNEGGYLMMADVHYRPSVAFWIILIITLFTWVFWLIPIVFYLVQKSSVRTAVEDGFKRIKDEFDEQTEKPAGAAGGSAIGDLEKLAALKERGLVTEAEFAAKKKQILGL